MSESDYRRPNPKEPEHLKCGVCMKEIPSSVAHSLEGPDYILQFCGLECLDRWREKEKKELQRRERWLSIVEQGQPPLLVTCANS